MQPSAKPYEAPEERSRVSQVVVQRLVSQVAEKC
jgi:hypothetical protein